MQPDFNASVGFLQLIYPDGPWMLTAISVDKKSIDARTFEVGAGVSSMDETVVADVLAWLQLHRTRNLYYSVNPPVPDAREKRKLSKSDVSRACYLHVDVDPRVGEDVEAEQARILRELDAYAIPPTAVVFSGGGYNALWKLDAPHLVADGSPSEEETVARAVDLERRNWQMELDFKTPDHCRDVSRILRLPGTVNRPNAEKIAKGRTPAVARLVHWRPDAVYPLSQFMAVPHVSANVPRRGSGVGATAGSGVGATAGSGNRISENVVRTESLDSLRIPESLRVIIAQGFDPAEPRRWEGDRSAALYYVVCELVRAGVSDEVILGVITDPRYLISESVLDKGSGVMRYAHRQVQRARDHADNPLLAEMNQRYAVILNYGSTPAIMVEEGAQRFRGGLELPGEYDPIFQSFRAFRDRIKNYPAVSYEVPSGGGGGTKTKSTSAFDWWTSHPRRREYRNVTFEPGLETTQSYNLWTGFAYRPVPGDKHLRYLEHMRENICSGNAEHYAYLEKWMARVVQTPRTQSMVAVVLLSPSRGTGKSVFSGCFGKLFGSHRFVASDIAQLTGRFNAHLSQCVYLQAEEVFDLGDKKHEAVLKERITGLSMSVERKSVDIIQLPNYVHVVMTSNKQRVVPAGDRERRFFVLRVGEGRIQDSEYFGRILRDMDEGGCENLLHHLLAVDLRGFDVCDVPRTEELRRQQEHNLPLAQEWLLTKLEAGQWFSDGRASWRGPIRKKMLHEDYRQYVLSLNTRAMIMGERAFHRFVVDELPGTTDRQARGRDPADRPMVFEFRPLEECREAFATRRGWTTATWRDHAEESPEGDTESSASSSASTITTTLPFE